MADDDDDHDHDDGDDGGRPFLPVLLTVVVLMAGVALLAYLAIVAVRGDDREPDPEQLAGPAPRADAAEPDEDDPALTEAPEDPELEVSDEDLLGLAADDLLAARLGERVSGRAVVDAVVADEGFWVGGGGRRVYVWLAPDARGGGGESAADIDAGDVVFVVGELVAPAVAPEGLAGLTGPEGLQQLLDEGAYVRALTYHKHG